MDIEAVAAAGAGLIRRLHGRIGIGDENDAREIAADKGLERRAQAREFIRQSLFERLFRILHADDAAALPEHEPLGRGADDDISDERSEIHVVGTDRQQYHIERALRLLLVHLRP